MPFLIWRHRQRCVDEGYDLLRKIWYPAVANPLSIAAVDHETRSLESRNVAGHAGLARAECAHQFADTMLAPIPHQTEGFKPSRFGESGKNHNGIHGVIHIKVPMRMSAYRWPSMACARPPKKSSAAARLLAFRPRFLNWRARDVPIGAKHAAIAFLWLETCLAALAHIEEHARVGWHGLRCAMPASRARNCRDELHHSSQELQKDRPL